jgi:hypothetical protein
VGPRWPTKGGVWREREGEQQSGARRALKSHQRLQLGISMHRKPAPGRLRRPSPATSARRSRSGRRPGKKLLQIGTIDRHPLVSGALRFFPGTHTQADSLRWTCVASLSQVGRCSKMSLRSVSPLWQWPAATEHRSERQAPAPQAIVVRAHRAHWQRIVFHKVMRLSGFSRSRTVPTASRRRPSSGPRAGRALGRRCAVTRARGLQEEK